MMRHPKDGSRGEREFMSGTTDMKINLFQRFLPLRITPQSTPLNQPC